MSDDEYLAGIMARDTPAQAPADAFDLEATKDKLAAAKVQGPIDKLHLGHSLRYAFCHVQAPALIAAVEALRERVAELEQLVLDGVRRSENCMRWQACAEAAEARCAELAGALEKASQFLDEGMGLKAYKLIKETAAATPEKVMERRQSEKMLMDKLAGVARAFLATGFGNTEDRFAAQDALDALKEGG